MDNFEDNEIDPNLMPELQDIINRIKAFNRLHPDGCFLVNILGFKKIPGSFCEHCGGECDEIDEDKSLICAFGDIETLRNMCDINRDAIEEYNEDGWVSI